MNRSKLIWVILVVLASVPSFISLIRPGFFPIQDDQHVFRFYEMQKCFDDGQIPCRWIPDGGYGYGYPQFNFYAPLVYYFGLVVHAFGFQFIDSIKILIILGFILSGIFMFLLTRQFFGNFSGYVTSILYIYSPYKAQQIYVRGSLSEFWAGVFFPALLFSTYKLVKVGSKKYLLLTSLLLAGLLLTHNILSYLFFPILVFWVGYWIYKDKNKKIKTIKTGLSMILGIGLSSFFTLPVIFERKFVHLETLLGGYFDYRQHFVSLNQLFFSNHWGYGSSTLGPGDDLSLSVGVVHWTIGVLAIVLALTKLKKEKILATLILGFGIIELSILFMMHQKSSFIWEIIKPLAWLQFPWRLLSLSSLILTFLSGYVIFATKKYRYVFGVFIMFCVFILHYGFFTPKTWINTNDNEELSGPKWERQLTSSIFDYLPIYAVLPPDSKATNVPEVIQGHVDFENFQKGSNFQTAKINASEDSRLRLPLFDFPGMTVYLNNKIIPHINNDCSYQKFCMGLITFDVSKGTYNFRVKLENTPIRFLGNLISIASLVFIIVFLNKKDVQIFKK